ncbi:MAG: right-handed parallel beta-helix repeat-containing protein [Deltaproteobacteria bacterium]|nr:right-handed parallel beta-helix repeat-containing protein [Deltaproteobacteria bacterium]
MLRSSLSLAAVLSAILLLAVPARADVIVSSPAQLRAAIIAANAGGDPTILLEDGTYTLPGDYYLSIEAPGVTIRSRSGDREAVVVQGQGMGQSPESIFKVTGDDFTCRDMTLRRTGNHVIQIRGESDCDGTVLKNLVIQDGYEQLVKISGNSGGNWSNGGLMEGCLLEYTAGIGPQWYIGGIDGHRCRNWTVRNNVFRHIISPQSSLAEHAVHFWSWSEDTLVEGNLIFNCDRGIGLGLGDSGHVRGVVRNNMLVHDGHCAGDVGIGLESCAGAQVYNNSVYLAHDYFAAIEYRFAATSNALIANNLTNRPIVSRNGGSGTLSHNVTTAQSTWFVDALAGNLHLASRVPGVVDAGTRDIPNLPSPFLDFDGKPRACEAVDIGADEICDQNRAMAAIFLLLND